MHQIPAIIASIAIIPRSLRTFILYLIHDPIMLPISALTNSAK